MTQDADKPSVPDFGMGWKIHPAPYPPPAPATLPSPEEESEEQ